MKKLALSQGTVNRLWKETPEIGYFDGGYHLSKCGLDVHRTFLSENPILRLCRKCEKGVKPNGNL